MMYGMESAAEILSLLEPFWSMYDSSPLVQGVFVIVTISEKTLLAVASRARQILHSPLCFQMPSLL
jgi:hypothetical protein